ncbi:MAG TPA: hypothetical protein VFO29_01950 [Candidatus Rubrimentiphilum sp.]|nr:hypothetical protein [Candidatus Rubrimentiphilum sp.]
MHPGFTVVRIALVALALILSGCGTPQQLPIEIPSCDTVVGSHGVTLTAVVKNDSYKPVSGLSIAADFYRDFRTTHLTGTTKIPLALNPGEERNVTFEIPTKVSGSLGRAMRCFATRVVYQDGTSQTVK